MQNKVVAHTLDGRVHKGITGDFSPEGEFFHLLPAEGGGIPQRLDTSQLKALFFVRDFLGNRDYDPPTGFGPAQSPGRRCVVTFSDGEVIFGFTPDFDEAKQSFTLVPSDPEDNNEKLIVFRAALESVRFP